MSEKLPRLDLKALPEADALAAIRQIYGWDEDQARFYLAVVRGEISGDIVEERGQSRADKGRRLARAKTQRGRPDA